MTVKAEMQAGVAESFKSLEGSEIRLYYPCEKSSPPDMLIYVNFYHGGTIFQKELILIFALLIVYNMVKAIIVTQGGVDNF